MLKYIFLITSLFLFTSCSNTSKNTQLSKKCLELPGKGRCKAYFEKFYFNTEEKKCKRFVWGGCGGNIPFHTISNCKKVCE